MINAYNYALKDPPAPPNKETIPQEVSSLWEYSYYLDSFIHGVTDLIIFRKIIRNTSIPKIVITRQEID